MKNGYMIYPDTKTSMEQFDLLTMEEYMNRRRETVSAYVDSTELFNK